MKADMQGFARPLAMSTMTVCLLASGLNVRANATSDLDDAAARAQYAFYAGDPRGLEQALALIDGLEVPSSLAASKEYYAAFASWKLAQLYGEAGNQASRTPLSKAAQSCEHHAEAAIDLDARMAEAHAIQAACGALGSTWGGGSCARSKSLRRALELAPQNPRVRLIEMMCAGKDGVVSASDVEELRALTTAFETAPPSGSGQPDWGQAEAWVLLGQTYLQHGDPVAARDAIERALIIAPDYRKARELLQNSAALPR
jgi:hypothetical protein